MRLPQLKPPSRRTADMCHVAGCRQRLALTYLGVGLCDMHWLRNCFDERMTPAEVLAAATPTDTNSTARSSLPTGRAGGLSPLDTRAASYYMVRPPPVVTAPCRHGCTDATGIKPGCEVCTGFDGALYRCAVCERYSAETEGAMERHTTEQHA